MRMHHRLPSRRLSYSGGPFIDTDTPKVPTCRACELSVVKRGIQTMLKMPTAFTTLFRRNISFRLVHTSPISSAFLVDAFLLGAGRVVEDVDAETFAHAMDCRYGDALTDTVLKWAHGRPVLLQTALVMMLKSVSGTFCLHTRQLSAAECGVGSCSRSIIT